jgi:ATP-binding cassette subfamily B protein
MQPKIGAEIGGKRGGAGKSPQSEPLWNFAEVARRLAPYLRPYRKQFFWGVLSILATNAVGALGPWVLKYAIQDLQAGVTSSKIYYYSFLIVVIALIAGLFRYWMRKIIVSISRHIEYDLRVGYFAHLERLSPSFYDRQQTGDLMTRATSDIEAVRMVVGPAVMYSLDTLLTAIFSLSLMLALSIPLTLAVLALAPILSLLIYYLARKIHYYSLQTQENYSDLNAMIQEHLSGVRVVRSYCQEKPEGELFRGLNERYIASSMKLVQLQALMIPFFYSAFGVGMAIVLYLGGKAIITGMMNLGDFVAFSAYVAMLAWPVIAVGWVLNLYQRGAASLQRIHKIMNTEPEIQNRNSNSSVRKLRGEITFKKVGFRYPGSATPALKEIDLHIPAGTSLGIVGQIGSGKSSLAALIPRLYEVTSGELLMDDVNVREIPLEILRRDVAVVPQESFLFSEPLQQNILFVNPELPLSKMREAAEIAHLNADVDAFPAGYETWVGERGITLSGGQKQRTGIARALAADPSILILDDCFSSVDTRTEAGILEKLRPFLKGRTVIVVAHRISTLQWADQIIVMEGGEIIERGTHTELIRNGGRYAELYRKQLLEEELRVAG